LKNLLLSAAVLLPVAALAASPGVTVTQNGVTVTHNGAKTMLQGAPGKQALPNWSPPAGKIKIFDTLGKKPYTYNGSEGWTIANAKSEAGSQQWYAFAVTPKANATVTEIVEAVSYVTGTNSVTIALLADNNGVPGDVLQEKTVKALQTFGDCCAVAVDKVKTGVQVKAGTTYWVAAILPVKKQSTTWDAWNFSSANTGSGTSAYYNGTWNVSSSEYAAFAIYGQ
jgi:hypothetical protein